ncbi:hypothetical protein M3665_23365, partial [Bacillus licheniformis]|nr:hypothetical protein [Bacillus licheniformis]
HNERATRGWDRLCAPDGTCGFGRLIKKPAVERRVKQPNRKTTGTRSGRRSGELHATRAARSLSYTNDLENDLRVP